MIYKIDDLIAERYRILKLLGSGAVATVYEALDEVTKRRVAIKAFMNDLKFSKVRIQREVEIISKLNHPNIATLFDVGVDDNTYYIVQELIEGVNLNSILQSANLTIDDAFKYIKDILGAVAYLHDNGIIHRDLKPSNIIINTKLKKAYIMDFNISKFQEKQEFFITVTQPGNLVGTPAYMAPEQMEHNDTAWQADMYSIGLIIYQIFTGELPFNCETMKGVYDRLAGGYEIKSDNINLKSAEDIAEIIKKMLAYDPNERPNAREVLEHIQSIEAQETEKNKSYLNKNEKTFSQNLENSNEVFELHINEAEKKSGTGIFCDEEVRKKEILESREFYRKHLDMDYKTLLFQAKVSFWLWVSSLILGFCIIMAAFTMLMLGKMAQSGAMAFSEVFIYIVQNIFKLREDHYREQANKKTNHLEIGNYWNIATQSIDAIEDKDTKTKKLIEVIDGINSHIYMK